MYNGIVCKLTLWECIVITCDWNFDLKKLSCDCLLQLMIGHVFCI